MFKSLKYLFANNKWALWLAIGLLLCNVNQWLTLSVLLYALTYAKEDTVLPSFFEFTGILLLLLLFFFFLVATDTHNMDIPTCLCMCFTSIVIYANGYAYSIKKHSFSEIYSLFIIIAIIIALPHVVVTIIDIFQNGLINEGRRLSILDSEKQLDTTLRVVNMSLSLIGCSYLFWLKDKAFSSRDYVYIFALFSIISLFCSMHYLSRSGLTLFLVPLIISLLWGKKHFSFSTIFFVAIIVLAIYYFSTSELFSLYEAREKEYSSVSNFGGRDKKWRIAWDFIKHNPLGEKNELYAHNMWLDFGKDGGIISFILFVLFSLINYLRIIKITTNKNIDKIVRFTITVFSIQIFLTCFTECIHEGARGYLYVYFLICGYTNRYAKLLSVSNRSRVK